MRVTPRLNLLSYDILYLKLTHGEDVYLLILKLRITWVTFSVALGFLTSRLKLRPHFRGQTCCIVYYTLLLRILFWKHPYVFRVRIFQFNFNCKPSQVLHHPLNVINWHFNLECKYNSTHALKAFTGWLYFSRKLLGSVPMRIGF